MQIKNNISGFLCLQQVAKLGSNANNEAKAGFFYWNLNNSSGNRNHNISGQLCLF